MSWLSIKGVTVPWEVTVRFKSCGCAFITRTVSGAGATDSGVSVGAVAIKVAAPNKNVAKIPTGINKVRIIRLRSPWTVWCFR